MTIDASVEDVLIAAAICIADKLCDSAIWTSDRRACRWLGEGLIRGQNGKSYSELSDVGGSLYGGTAGIALFLGEIGALTGNARFEDTARGGVRHAFWNTPDNPGLFSGQLGTAIALLRVSRCLSDSSMYEDSQSLLAGLLRLEIGTVRDLDFMGGLAGMILGLLNVNRRGPDASLLRLARQMGSALCERADWAESYCSWIPDMAGEIAERPLTGFSHGSSGIGAALLALFAETGEEDFLMTGRGAFAYDDAVFNEQSQTWPDMRSNPMHVAIETWCYGAPGIMIARIIAAASDPEFTDQHRYYAGVAAEVTSRSLREFWMRPGRESCLCHGSIGACEALMIAGEYGLGENHRADAARAASELARRCNVPEDWPLRLQSPTLLMGLAGVGHGLIRLARPKQIEPVLLIH